MSDTRYKNQTFHMMESFNYPKKTQKSKMYLQTARNSNQQYFDRVIGENGNTWDARHLTSFLQKSEYSNQDYLLEKSRSLRLRQKDSVHKRAISTHDHFFKTTKDNKNQSKIGFTGINPLVTYSSVEKKKAQPIQKYLNSQINLFKDNKSIQNNFIGLKEGSQNKFRFTANQIKFRKTDPMTSHHINQKSPSNFDKQRMMRLITKRHPHGMTGIDHPQNPQTKYYDEKKLNMSVKIRRQPNSYRHHIIDPLWKSKGRKVQLNCPIYGGTKGNLIQERKFNNDNVHGFNIISNRVYVESGRVSVM